MHQVIFHVGRLAYVAQLELDPHRLVVTLSVHRRGDDHPQLLIYWEPKAKYQYFEAREEELPVGVVKGALKIWDDYRKTPASKVLHKRKPVPEPKAVQVLRKQLNEALMNEDDVKFEALNAKFDRAYNKTLVLLPLAG